MNEEIGLEGSVKVAPSGLVIPGGVGLGGFNLSVSTAGLSRSMPTGHEQKLGSEGREQGGDELNWRCWTN